MNPLKAVTLPQYLFNLRQVLVRLRRSSQQPSLKELVSLPWGGRIWIRPHEVIGASLWYYGIFDLVVAEAIARLLDPGETALDIGANIGQMTRLMRVCAGQKGRVIAFEPHPEIFEELRANQAPELAGGAGAPIELHQIALGNQTGTATLDAGSSWETNRGMSKIIDSSAAAEGQRVEVPIACLDDVLGRETRVGVAKLDVEGHEFKVLEGARQCLETQRVRDVIFEDFGVYPSPVHRRLQQCGYTLYVLSSRLPGPQLTSVAQTVLRAPASEYLATLEPARAEQRFCAWGWRVLRLKAPA